jgi:hypothetical protein
MISNIDTRPFRIVNGLALDRPKLIVADPWALVPFMKLLTESRGTCSDVLGTLR